MIRLLRKLPSLWLCCNSRCQEMFPKACFSIRLSAVAHFDTRRSRWTAFFFQTKTKLTQGGLVKLGVTAQMSARVGASLLEMKPFCRMPRGFLSPVIISRVCLTATSLWSRPAPLIFYFFHSDGKKLSGARKVFFSLVAHALKAISAHLVFWIYLIHLA